MPYVSIVTAVLGLLNGMNQQSQQTAAVDRTSAEAAAATEAGAGVAQENLDFQKELFADQRAYLSPFMEGGQTAFMAQQALSGLAGSDAQKEQIDLIQNMPGFREMINQGETSILQNAAATGGLRGGNTQGFLAQYRPQMLRDAIQNRYSMLGGLANSGLGASSALNLASAGVGNASTQLANIYANGVVQAPPAAATPVTTTNNPGGNIPENYPTGANYPANYPGGDIPPPSTAPAPTPGAVTPTGYTGWGDYQGTPIGGYY
jgi:hypothetical protein